MDMRARSTKEKIQTPSVIDKLNRDLSNLDFVNRHEKYPLLSFGSWDLKLDELSNSVRMYHNIYDRNASLALHMDARIWAVEFDRRLQEIFSNGYPELIDGERSGIEVEQEAKFSLREFIRWAQSADCRSDGNGTYQLSFKGRLWRLTEKEYQTIKAYPPGHLTPWDGDVDEEIDAASTLHAELSLLRDHMDQVQIELDHLIRRNSYRNQMCTAYSKDRCTHETSSVNSIIMDDGGDIPAGEIHRTSPTDQ
ncbi:hypothetical protein N7462_008006 [Penicillium macrosclerotiorum]|uniref:uncharacterized protein n=1 Tax=Penicillium macrosclerotiorum TaxID=303699 RepID=UPI0025499F05|nr:uncharacterized protein N7462_008006 [Penicillium macrosclerotiorum]KAJ5679762.1 hypothetical protein N7462_008006 [Penicillium macrosclerotiorum]